GSNYFMYMANINSLNKRMGELRYNANAQGVWARVFNGMLSSDLHTANTKSIYTTFQTGYDYAFGMEGANNYLGFAISYINAINDSQSKLDIDGLQKGVKDSLSNGVEVAIYNAYVQDGASKANGFKNGLYTDTILKFSFMNNKLHMFGQTDDYSINNFALTFSQEAGYRFLLGNHDEWFIDPQAELTIGFFDQSEFVQKLGNNYLVGTQNAILNIRGRVGSNFGYKFDHLTENKGFTSQLYLGMYYVGNYTSGGDGALVSNLGSKTTLNALTSHSSFLINVGTNFTIKDKHRIYFDFERSFFGPIVTNYQVNLGYRFSFGESKYTPLATNLANEIKKAKEVKAKAEEVEKK
ncbi:autotransporter outer membrane beta-barrel domain-containing protein, partial [Helicobacter anatolicus]|uniref:autotransporter outer membrane beta-barrel domain-containing protein n=1 Tax=Helicobacter anatolicus TaxID=2905874 RepID=UPI001E56A69A